MKLIGSIYDHGVVIHMKVCQDILSNRGVITLWLLKFKYQFVVEFACVTVHCFMF